MKVLAIDASTKSTGVALFEDTKLIKYTCLTASSNDVIKRIQKIIQELNVFIGNETIDKVILEEVRPEQEFKIFKRIEYYCGCKAQLHFFYMKLNQKLK